jgi:hypothetical protein
LAALSIGFGHGSGWIFETLNGTAHQNSKKSVPVPINYSNSYSKCKHDLWEWHFIATLSGPYPDLILTLSLVVEDCREKRSIGSLNRRAHGVDKKETQPKIIFLF